MFQSYRTDIETALRGVSDDKVLEAAMLLRKARASDSSVYVMGNGGSAATASHFANDLVKMCGIRAFSLPDMVSSVTAYGNDDGWQDMYAHLLKRLLCPFDIVVGISCSGNSPNVVSAMVFARHFNMPGLKTLGLIGWDLGCGVGQATPDVLVSVPFREIKVVEDCHLIICHAIAGALSDGKTTTKGVL